MISRELDDRSAIVFIVLGSQANVGIVKRVDLGFYLLGFLITNWLELRKKTKGFVGSNNFTNLGWCKIVYSSIYFLYKHMDNAVNLSS